MERKLKASDKRLKAYNKEIETRILHPAFESRVTIAELFDKLKPERLITGRKCTGSKRKLNKTTQTSEEIPTYKVTRRFVEFEDKSRLSVSTAIFSHLKIDHKLEHTFENYLDSDVKSEVKQSKTAKLF